MRTETYLSPLLMLALVLGLLAAGSGARAAEFCVASTNELVSAIVLAQFNSQDNVIKLRAGTYPTPDGLTYNAFTQGDLEITGGWNPSCTSRSPNPASTIIDRAGGDPLVDVWRLQTGSGSIRISGMQFANQTRLEFSDFSTNCTRQGQRLAVDRMIFSSTPTGTGGALLSSKCHDLDVENVLAVGGAGLTLSLGSDELGTQVQHTTIVNSALGIQGGEGAIVQLYNNVLRGLGVEVFSSTFVLARNNFWSQIDFNGAGGSLFAGSGANSTSNPQLGSDFRLLPTSPAINSGTAFVPGGLPATDLDGGPRVVGSLPDCGAYESAVTDTPVITVTNNFDSGPGSLREAIQSSNVSPGRQLIRFAISGSCPRRISLLSPLPEITDSVTFDGYSQNGSMPNSRNIGSDGIICIELQKSSSVSSIGRGLYVPSTSNASLKVSGLAFGDFHGAGLGTLAGGGVYLAGGQGHVVQGNRFGGGGLEGNANGVYIGNGVSAPVLIGGEANAHRNTFSDGLNAGISIADQVSGVEVINNYIGTSPNGTVVLGNRIGILLFGTDTLIERNVVAGSEQSGIQVVGSNGGLFSADNRINGNRIGLTFASSASVFGNSGAGIYLNQGARANSMGGVGLFGAVGAGNVISNNATGGIVIENGRLNLISRNRIYGNTGLGIDLANDGVTPNDNDAGLIPVDFANRGINFPVLALASGDSTSGVVSGSLSSLAGTYRLEFFANNVPCDPSGHGEGAIYVGATALELGPGLPGVQAGPLGGQFTANFVAPIQGALFTPDTQITATASDNGNTSEFSACLAYASSDVLFADGFDLDR